ncbi:MAG: TRAP transporter small permease [Pseudomonadota bacterium]
MSEETSTDAGKADQGTGLAIIVRALELLGSVFLVTMMVLTFVDVIGRYLLSQPVFGANEMISALLALVIFSGLGIANARDDHIVVELMDHRIRQLAPRFYAVVIQSFSVLVMALIAFVLLELALEAWAQNTLTFVLEIPLAWIAGSVSLLAALSVVSQIMGIYLKARQASRRGN